MKTCNMVAPNCDLQTSIDANLNSDAISLGHRICEFPNGVCDMGTVVEENQTKLSFRGQVVDNELLGGRSQQVPDVVPIHGLRIFEDEDVAWRLLTTYDELRSDLGLRLGGWAHLGPEFEIWMHTYDLQGRFSETVSVL